MSTRCNIALQNKNRMVLLYRHHDGYPAVTGLWLARAMRRAQRSGMSEPTATANLLLRDVYPATDHLPARPVAELADDVQADIEWLYLVDFAARAYGEPVVSVFHARPFEGDMRRVFVGYWQDFARWCGQQRATLTRRWKAIQAAGEVAQ